MALLKRNSFVPAYYQIGDHLKERILSGELPSGSKLPPEEEMAREYGVARVTLRRALDKLAQEGFAKRLQGRGSFVADHIPGATRVVSILLSNFHTGHIAESLSRIITGATFALKERGYAVRIDATDELEQLLDDRRRGKLKIDGMLPIRIDPRYLDVFDKLTKAGVPFVAEGVTGAFNWVDIDNAAGVKKAFAYLRSLGHREFGIGFIEGQDKKRHLARRHEIAENLLIAEFGEANAAYNLSVKLNDPLDAAARAAAFLRRKKKPTALLCVSDLVALPVICQAPFVGVSVPDDLSVVGFEDMQACQYVSPPLTTVRQDYAKHGYVTAQKLIERMNDCDLRKINEKIVPELIVRNSCAKIKIT